MGVYLSPSDESQEAFLDREGTLVLDLSTVAYNDVRQKGLVPVAVADNGTFRAAAIAYDEREFQRLSSPDPRPVAWYLVPVDKLKHAVDKDKFHVLMNGVAPAIEKPSPDAIGRSINFGNVVQKILGYSAPLYGGTAAMYLMGKQQELVHGHLPIPAEKILLPFSLITAGASLAAFLLHKAAGSQTYVLKYGKVTLDELVANPLPYAGRPVELIADVEFGNSNEVRKKGVVVGRDDRYYVRSLKSDKIQTGMSLMTKDPLAPRIDRETVTVRGFAHVVKNLKGEDVLQGIYGREILPLVDLRDR